MTLLAELENEWFRNVSFFGHPRAPEPQPQPKSPIHIAIKSPKSPKAPKNHRHDSESETFSDDAGGRVKGWRKSIRSMDEESVCESSSCVRKKRRHRFKYDGSDTDGGAQIEQIDSHGEDSDVERYQLRPRGRNPQRCASSCGDETDDMSDCSSPNYTRSETPGCCCHLYDDDDYSDYSYDVEEDNESVGGWAHFIDADASIYGYDYKRDGHYSGRKQRRGLFGLIQGVFQLLRFFWRWCRFLSILSTAMAIALYRGPDALLTDS